MCIYNTATNWHGAKTGTKDNVLKAKLLFNRAELFKGLALAPPSRKPPLTAALAAKIYLGLPNEISRVDAPCRVSVFCCKPCANAHGSSDLPRLLPAVQTPYVLSNYNAMPPPLPRHLLLRHRVHRTPLGRENHQPPVCARSARNPCPPLKLCPAVMGARDGPPVLPTACSPIRGQI